MAIIISQILDIINQTEFGNKVKEYLILYLYDNIHEIVPKSRLKCPNSFEDNYLLLEFLIIVTMIKPQRKPYKRRSDAQNCHENVNIFYDAKTKKFTENCKLRRLKLSGNNVGGGDDVSNDVVENRNALATFADVLQPVDHLRTESSDTQSPLPEWHISPPLEPERHSLRTTQRYSQRPRRSSYQKADYFYPDSLGNAQLTDAYTVSNNNELLVSMTLKIDASDELDNNSSKLTRQDCSQNPSLNHSPISLLLPSTEHLLNLRHKNDLFPQISEENGIIDVQGLYKTNEDGKHQCLICTNKTFRKKQLIIDHLKHYHPMVNDHQSNEQFIQPGSKTVYSSQNKRYYSSYLKANRKSIVRKKKYNTSKIKSLMSGNSWNIYSSRKHKSDNSHVSLAKKARTYSYPGAKDCPNNNIIYCYRCKKSTDNGHMVQCIVCLCWSHTACYGLSEHKDNDSFWECDSCANDSVVNGTKTADWYRDRYRFHSVARNELPWLTKNVTTTAPCNIRNIGEMQSFLVLCQNVLNAIIQHMDKLAFKNSNDSSCQDDLEILKNLYSYENLDEINITRLDNIDSLALTVDNDDIFRVSSTSGASASACASTTHPLSLHSFSKTILAQDSIQTNSSHFHFPENAFSNSMTNSITHHKKFHTTFDGILDCELQKLDIIPSADFDALVKDLNLNDDICKTSSLSNHSKSSILDLIDDRGKMGRGGIVLDYGTDHMSELSCDDIASLLVDKYSQKSNMICVSQDSQEPLCLISDYSSDNNGRESGANGIGLVGYDSNGSGGNIPCTDTCIVREVAAPRCRTSQAQLKIDIELAAGSSDNCHLEPSALPQAQAQPSSEQHTSSELLIDSIDPDLSSLDRRSLEWLWSKYRYVESVVSSIDDSLASSNIVGSHMSVVNEEHCGLVRRYLHSLLYILRQD